MTVPKVFGRYKVEKILGQGAAGTVYLAEDPIISRQVAIKAIETPVNVSKDAMLTRFDLEFRSAGNFTHPNVVTIYDVGTQGDTPFLAMEYVKGQTLEDALATLNILSIEHTADLITQVCDALDYAHEQGIVHRDIKPANILMTDKGQPKISDFGVAKFTTENETSVTSAAGVTQHGMAIGTPAYMSPEQAQGKLIDGRSDQFAVGVMLYRMLTGKRPFTADNPTTTMYQIVHEQPPAITALNPRLPPGLNDVVVKALAKDPSQRYSCCNQLADAIQHIVSHARSDATVAAAGVVARPVELSPGDVSLKKPTYIPPVDTGEAEKRKSSPQLLAIGSISAIIILVAVVWMSMSSNPEPIADTAASRGTEGATELNADALVEDTNIFSSNVRVESESAGAEIWMNDRDLATLTPADVTVEGLYGEPVQLELRRGETVTATTSILLGSDMPTAWSPEELIEPVALELYQIVTRPTGAQIILNGETLDGSSPLTVELRPGTLYNIRTELDGYEAAGLGFTLDDLSTAQRADQTLTFPLTASYLPGYLFFEASYEVALELRDTRATETRMQRFGPATILDVPVRPGEYEIRLSAPSVFYERTMLVNVREGARRELRLPGAVTIQVAAVPSNCRVTIDGRDVDATPFSIAVTLGRHAFEFEWPALNRTVMRNELISQPQQRIFATVE